MISGFFVWLILSVFFNIAVSVMVDDELISKTESSLYQISQNGKILDKYYLLDKYGEIIINDGNTQTSNEFDKIIYSDKNLIITEIYGIKNKDKFPLNLFPIGLAGREEKTLYITK